MKILRLVGLIAALAAPATAAAVHSGYISTGFFSTGFFRITQPDLLIASFNASDGSVEYSGKYHVEFNKKVEDLTSSGGSQGGWGVSQAFEATTSVRDVSFKVDYTFEGVYAGSCASSYHGGVQKVPLRQSTEKSTSPAGPRVHIKFNKQVITFRNPGQKYDKYAMHQGGLYKIGGEKTVRFSDLFSNVRPVHLEPGQLIAPFSDRSFLKIRPDLGEIVVHNRRYRRSGWSAMGKPWHSADFLPREVPPPGGKKKKKKNRQKVEAAANNNNVGGRLLSVATVTVTAAAAADSK